VTAGPFRSRLLATLRAVRIGRLATLLLVSLALALAGDWLRTERVMFPAPLPVFRTLPR